MLYLDAMKVPSNISKKKSVIKSLLLAILSAGIFFLHETGPGRPVIQKESVLVATGFESKHRNAPGIYSLSGAAAFQAFKNDRFQFLILKALSKKLNNSISARIIKSQEELPSSTFNSAQHFRSRSLTSEDPFISFS